MWDTVHLATWSVVELNTGIIAGSLPSLRPIFKQFLGSVYAPGTKSNRYYGGGVNSKSRGSNWKSLSSGGVRSTTGGESHQALPLHSAGRSLGRSSSQARLQEHAVMPGSATGKTSFELSTYKVEAHVSSDKESRKSIESVRGGIVKTTHTVISYYNSREA